MLPEMVRVLSLLVHSGARRPSQHHCRLPKHSQSHFSAFHSPRDSECPPTGSTNHLPVPEKTLPLSPFLPSGRRTYVHCTAGINRANLSVLGFLTWVKEMDYDAAHALIKEARPQANPYKVSWEIAGGRLVAGKEEDLYLALTKKGASELDGGDWIARDIAGARTAVIMEMFRRRTEVDMQLVVSAGGLGRKPSKARRALTAEGAKPRNTVTDEDYDSYDDDSSEDGSDDEEEDEGMKSPPPPKARNSPLPKEAGAGKGGKGGKSGKDKGKGKKD